MNLSADFARSEITLNFEASSEEVIIYFVNFVRELYKWQTRNNVQQSPLCYCLNGTMLFNNWYLFFKKIVYQKANIVTLEIKGLFLTVI